MRHRQAKEIRELRRKLRESRLILPPRAYRAVKSSEGHGDDDDDDDGEESEEEPSGRTGDETYDRIKVILERLLETGRRALESKGEDFQEGGKVGTKVLSADEVRSWRRYSSDGPVGLLEPSQDDPDPDQADASVSESASHLGMLDSDDGLASEEEVEAMAFAPDTAYGGSAPPIHIIS